MQNFVEAEDYKYWVREFERKETWFRYWKLVHQLSTPLLKS